MTFIQVSKRLVGFSLVLGAVALLAGCHSTKHQAKSDYGVYSQPAMGATTVITESTQAAASSEPVQGQVSVPVYEEQLVVGTREVDSGGVRLRKQVTTETVSQPVQIQRETITVERQQAAGGQTSMEQTGKQSGSLGTPFEPGEITIRLHSQEPVVEKRIVPSGNVVVQTRKSTEQMNVQREVRKEKVDVENLGGSQNVIISEQTGVGAAPAPQQQTQGKGSKEIIEEKEIIQEYRAPVTTEENAPFPRPQPDGKDTFPDLNKNPAKP